MLDAVALKRSPTLILLLVIFGIACVLYLTTRSTQQSSPPPSHNNTFPRENKSRRPRQAPSESSPPEGSTATSCNALGVTCASTYFASWKWPDAGSCILGQRRGYPVPDPRCTPGGTVPNMSVAILNNPGWRTKCIRNCQSTEKQKHVTYSWYGVTSPTGNNGANQVCELDHLVPLELGGADGLGNIWPQCGPEDSVLRDRYFKRKDQVENYLAAQVRAGAMSLDEAQRGIASDWTQYLDVASGSGR